VLPLLHDTDTVSHLGIRKAYSRQLEFTGKMCSMKNHQGVEKRCERRPGKATVDEKAEFMPNK
jgi:hypothetical protein